MFRGGFVPGPSPPFSSRFGDFQLGMLAGKWRQCPLPAEPGGKREPGTGMWGLGRGVWDVGCGIWDEG